MIYPAAEQTQMHSCANFDLHRTAAGLIICEDRTWTKKGTGLPLYKTAVNLQRVILTLLIHAHTILGFIESQTWVKYLFI